MPHIVQLHFFLLIPDHKSSCIEAKLTLIKFCWENVVMILLFPLTLLSSTFVRRINGLDRALIRHGLVGLRKVCGVVGTEVFAEHG